MDTPPLSTSKTTTNLVKSSVYNKPRTEKTKSKHFKQYNSSRKLEIMESIMHRTVSVNGIKMHIAEKGQGPVVLFLHGFPEFWYTWRHQILALSSKGYHAVAPDLRGYGDTDAPSSPSSYTYHHIIGDLVGLLDSLGVEKVFLVAHDWGAMIGWYLCLLRPDRVKAFVCLSVPYPPRNPKIRPVEGMRLRFGDDYYMCRFQEAGVIEAEMQASGTAQVLKRILTNRKPGPPYLAKENPYGTNQEDPITLPSWFTEADLSFCVEHYTKSGFTGGLNYYRALDLNWELTAPWTGAMVTVPVKYVTGDLDMVYTTPGTKEFVDNGGFKYYVPFLEEIVILEGVGHFINQERAEEINSHIYDFITKFE